MSRYFVLVNIIILFSLYLRQSSGLSSTDPPLDRSQVLQTLVNVGVGTAATVNLGKLAYQVVQDIPPQYPPAHEKRLVSTITTSLSAAAATRNQSSSAFRILEVGSGTDLRLIRRGLWDEGLQKLAKQFPRVEYTAVDLRRPKTKIVQQAQERLATTTLNLQTGDITQRLDFPDGYFDVVLCCLTLCSVTTQIPAISELRRLVRANGGTLGYLEHVAADRPFLEFQQRLFDPLQQIMADNCHLHRSTQEAIEDVFGAGPAEMLDRQRFYVDGMWPVSCQACGVIQRIEYS